MEEKDYKDLLSCLNEEQFTKFINSLNDDPIKGACYNPKNISFETIKENISGALDEEYGFLSYPFGTLVGNDPLYFGGAFYPLDHSSFAVSRNLSLFLKDKNDLKILDLCAAPGGKSLHVGDTARPLFSARRARRRSAVFPPARCRRLFSTQAASRAEAPRYRAARAPRRGSRRSMSGASAPSS